MMIIAGNHELALALSLDPTPSPLATTTTSLSSVIQHNHDDQSNCRCFARGRHDENDFPQPDNAKIDPWVRGDCVAAEKRIHQSDPRGHHVGGGGLELRHNQGSKLSIKAKQMYLVWGLKHFSAIMGALSTKECEKEINQRMYN